MSRDSGSGTYVGAAAYYRDPRDMEGHPHEVDDPG
jgi:hypothetical protein